LLFVSDDLTVVRMICDRTIVLRNGGIVEQGESRALFDNPRTDYTRELVEAIPISRSKRRSPPGFDRYRDRSGGNHPCALSSGMRSREHLAGRQFDLFGDSFVANLLSVIIRQHVPPGSWRSAS
jgi:ABC-type glutathione transport system ATPase component